MTAPLTNGGLRHAIATQAQDGIRHAEARIRVCVEEIGRMQVLRAQLETALIGLGVTYEAAPEPAVSLSDPRD